MPSRPPAGRQRYRDHADVPYLKIEAKKPFTFSMTPLRGGSGGGSAMVSKGVGVVGRDMGRVPAPRSGADVGG